MEEAEVTSDKPIVIGGNTSATIDSGGKESSIDIETMGDSEELTPGQMVVIKHQKRGEYLRLPKDLVESTDITLKIFESVEDEDLPQAVKGVEQLEDEFGGSLPRKLGYTESDDNTKLSFYNSDSKTSIYGDVKIAWLANGLVCPLQSCDADSHSPENVASHWLECCIENRWHAYGGRGFAHKVTTQQVVDSIEHLSELDGDEWRSQVMEALEKENQKRDNQNNDSSTENKEESGNKSQKLNRPTYTSSDKTTEWARQILESDSEDLEEETKESDQMSSKAEIARSETEELPPEAEKVEIQDGEVSDIAVQIESNTQGSSYIAEIKDISVQDVYKVNGQRVYDDATVVLTITADGIETIEKTMNIPVPWDQESELGEMLSTYSGGVENSASSIGNVESLVGNKVKLEKTDSGWEFAGAYNPKLEEQKADQEQTESERLLTDDQQIGLSAIIGAFITGYFGLELPTLTLSISSASSLIAFLLATLAIFLTSSFAAVVIITALDG